jgi:sugar-specific transcriptional regulator TrmB
MISQKLLMALKDLGLTEDEAKLYGRLVAEGGPTTVSNMSRITGYSRTKVYAIFDKLCTKGWVKLASNKPKAYIALDPRTIVSDRKKSIVAAYATVEKQLSPVYSKARVAEYDNNATLTYRGVAVWKKLQDMLTHAKHEVYIVLSFVPRKVAKSTMRLLISLKAKGAVIKGIISNRFRADPEFKRLQHKVGIKSMGIPRAGLVIVDNSEALIGSMSDSNKPSLLMGIWVKNKEFVKLCKMSFEELYNICTAPRKSLHKYKVDV